MAGSPENDVDDASHKGSISSSSGPLPIFHGLQPLVFFAGIYSLIGEPWDIRMTRFARDKMHKCLWLQKDHHSTNILV